MKIIDVTRTCYACPSQWEGRDETHFYYIRYRWGTLRVSRSLLPKEEIFDEILFNQQIGYSLDGLIMIEEVNEHLTEVQFKEIT